MVTGRQVSVAKADYPGSHVMVLSKNCVFGVTGHEL